MLNLKLFNLLHYTVCQIVFAILAYAYYLIKSESNVKYNLFMHCIILN